MHRLSSLLLASLPLAAQAEVLDKEFSFPIVVSLALVGTVASFLAARYHPWLLAAVLPAVALLLGAHLSELLEPTVGRAMVVEGGAAYWLISCASPVIVLAGCAVGLAARARRGRVGA